MKMRKMIREPLLHFLLIGAGLFLLFGWRGGTASLPTGQSGPQSAQIVVAQDDIDQLVGTFTRTWQRPPTEEEVKGLVESFIRDEIYYREAVAAGLDRDDSVIRRRMRLKMEYIFEDIAAQVGPTDADLQAFLKKNPEQYLIDPQIAFRQVYINADKRKKDAWDYAVQVIAELNRGADPDSSGDPFLLDAEVRLSPLWDIKKQFGEEFGSKILELKQGKWEGPVRSGYGLHLVLVTKRVGGRMPELKEVRDIVKRDWMAERQKELKDAAYASLRERYTVVVEKPKAVVSAEVTETGGRTVRR
jgi:hypothetical protein